MHDAGLKAGPLANAARGRALDELRHACGKTEALRRCADLLLSADPAVAGAEISRVVMACRGVGRMWAGEMMQQAGVNPFKRVGDLVPRELSALVSVLRAGDRQAVAA